MQLKKKIILFVIINLLFVGREACGINDECIADMRSLQQLINRHVRNTGDDPADVCRRCPGVPGKRGNDGIRGFSGERGPKGNTGTCSCDLSVFREFDAKLKEIEDFLTKVKRNTVFSEECYAGITSGRIPINRVTASSTHSTCPMSGVPLNSGAAWCAGTNNLQQWIQVDLATSKLIPGVVTKGRANYEQIVKSYKISYGNDTNNLKWYKEFGLLKVFIGNIDRNTEVINRFSTPITARYLRLHPVAYTGHISLRLDIIVC